MPCRGPDLPDNSNAIGKAVNNVLQELEPLLCEACSIIEQNQLSDLLSSKLRAWFKAHDKCEEDRVRLEAAQKLSARERRLLGINLQDLKKKVSKNK